MQENQRVQHHPKNYLGVLMSYYMETDEIRKLKERTSPMASSRPCFVLFCFDI
jgi:hypothetical protein